MSDNNTKQKDIYTRFVELLDEEFSRADIQKTLLGEFDKSFVDDILMTHEFMMGLDTPMKTLSPSKESLRETLSTLHIPVETPLETSTPSPYTQFISYMSTHYKAVASFAVIVLIVIISTQSAQSPSSTADLTQQGAEETFDTAFFSTIERAELSTASEETAAKTTLAPAPAEDALMTSAYDAELTEIVSSLSDDLDTIDSYDNEPFETLENDLTEIQE